MKKGWLVLLMLLVGVNAPAQKNNCDCEAFLSPEYGEVLFIYPGPADSAQLYAVKNNALDEEFIHFSVLAQKGAWLQVAPYDVNRWYDTGWIANSHVAVYGKNYTAPINIYKKRDTSSSVIMTIPAGYQPEYHVTGCNGRWLQVTFLYNDAEVKGWLSPDDQCGSAYTECK